MRAIYIFPLFFLLFSFCRSNASIQTEIKIYDQYYAQRSNIENVFKAVKGHLKLLKKNPQSIDLLWRLSMEYYFLGHKSTNEEKKLLYHQKGIQYGKLCSQLAHGKRVECPFWQATNLALYLQEKGLFSIAFKIKEIIRTYKKAEDLDPLYLGAGPLRMQSIFYYKAPRILGGDHKLAIKLIEKAIKLAPKEPLNYHFYLQYLTNDGQEKKGKEVARQAVNSIDPSNIPFYESRGAFKDIVKFLETGIFTP